MTVVQKWNLDITNAQETGKCVCYITSFPYMDILSLNTDTGIKNVWSNNRTAVARHEGCGKKQDQEQGKKHKNKQTNKLQYITIKRLDCSNVIRVELHAFHVPCVVRVHDSTLNIRMINTEWVTKFVSGNPKQVSSFWGVVSKLFVFVKVGTAIRWKERMRQNSTLTIERVCARSFTWTAMSSSAKTAL